MEASIESSNAEVAAQKKSSLTAEKNALLLQRRAVLTISVCKQMTSEGVDLRISSTTLAYPLQKKHYPFCKVTWKFSFKILYSITEKRKSFQIINIS